MLKTLMIGDLAAATGTKVNTIRFYEETGLMRRADRTASGRRTYDVEDLKRLRFIRRARKLGFETKEIRSLLALSDRPEAPCGEVTAIALAHLTDIETRISQLTRLRDELHRVSRLCAGGSVAQCQILEQLAENW